MWQLPYEWDWLSLKELSDVIMGQSPPGSTYNNSGNGLPFYQGKAEFGDVYPTPVKWCTDPRKIAEEGDVLLSVRAPVGPTNLAKEKCCIGRGLAAIRPKGKLSTKYLMFSLRALETILSGKGTGSTFSAVGKKVLENFTIPVPYPNDDSRSLNMQERIVARIESLLSEVKEARKLLDKMRWDAERVMDAALEEIFAFSEPSWIETELGNLIKFKSGQFLRSKDMKAGGKHPVYGGNGLAGYHDEYLFEDSKVIIGRVGAKCGCIHISEPKSWITDNALYVHEKLTPLDNAYLAYLLSAAKLNQYASRAAQPVISGRTIYPVKLKYTNDLNQQKAIVIHLDNIRSEMANINATIEKSFKLVGELEQSVLNRAFRGDL